MNTTWPRQAYIKASAVDIGDGFGRSIDLSESGDLLLVGAPHEDGGVAGSPSDNSAHGSGAAVLFERNAGVWTQEAYVKAGNIGNDDQFGRFVSLRSDGGVLAVSATFEDSACHCVNDGPIDEASSNSGAVYVFNHTNGVVSQRDYVKAPNTGAADYFGHGLSLSGNGLTLAIGAEGEDSNATGVNGNMWNDLAPSAGAAFVYSW
jgi:trimeric autotransporter adhesin